MASALKKVEIKKVIGPTPAGAAILLGNEAKTFVVFIGYHEARALIRELKGEPVPRPLTHDLIQSIFLGFDLSIKKIIISDIVDNAFCATLILEQKVNEKNGEWAGRRNEVRIDARPSDCLVLAMKNSTDLFVTEEVFDQVQDFSQLSQEGQSWLSTESLLEEDVSGPRSGGSTGSASSEEEETEKDDDDDDSEE